MIRLTLLVLSSLVCVQTIFAAACPTLLDTRMENLSGEIVDFCDYSDKVILAVNTASYCGNTPQYEALESLYQRYKDKNFVIIGFPANNFGGQEPGSDEEIKEFCEVNFGVTFPMVTKSDVLGANANPIFVNLAKITGKSPQWNFHKYLIPVGGQSAESFPAFMNPLNSKLTAAIEKLVE